MKSATVILTDIDPKTCRSLKGDLYVFDPELASKLDVAKEAADRIRSLHLYDIDPQTIIWCREEVLARKEEITAAVAKESWARVAASFFKDKLYFDFCGRLLCDYYYSFLKIVLKLKYLHDRYDEVFCVVDEMYDLYDRFFLALLSDELRSAWDHTTFEVQRTPAIKEVSRRIWQFIYLFGGLWINAKLGSVVRYFVTNTFKYLVWLDTESVHNSAILSPENENAMTFRDATFMVDGRSIGKDDVIFYLSNPCEEAIASLRKMRYHFVDHGHFKAALSLKTFLRLMFSFCVTALLMQNSRVPHHLRGHILHSFSHYLKTTALAQHVPCSVRITQQDIEPNQIIRTIAFKHQGVITAQFQDSMNWFMEEGVPNPLAINLAFDYFFSTGKNFTDMFQQHTNNIGAYHEIGLIRIARKGRLQEKASKERTTILEKDIAVKTVITVFDENALWRDTEVNIPNWKEMWGYLDDILNTLREQADYFFIYKPKLPDKGTSGAAMTVEQKTGLPFFALREKLRLSNRVKVLDHRVDSIYAILLADIVIAPPFSTTGMEALAVGKKVIYYDFGSKFLSHKYSKIDKFVAHNFEELKDMIKYWKDADESKRQKVVNALKDDVLISTEDPIAKFTAILDNELGIENV
jgi:polysaccharide biosynthesis PFTS motif protein